MFQGKNLECALAILCSMDDSMNSTVPLIINPVTICCNDGFRGNLNFHDHETKIPHWKGIWLKTRAQGQWGQLPLLPWWYKGS